jgi:hypothetical protein
MMIIKLINTMASLQIFIAFSCSFPVEIVLNLSGFLVTTAWCILRLLMEEKASRYGG